MRGSDIYILYIFKWNPKNYTWSWIRSNSIIHYDSRDKVRRPAWLKQEELYAFTNL
jgi:hypothetical protein